jgi:hypothetical protein
MYEHRSQPLLSRRLFARRLLRHWSIALLTLLASLAAGVTGYHVLEGMPWVDSLLNASMILGGMGPVNELHTTGGKLFASCYALFSGIIFLVVAGTLLAPLVHRFFHQLHLDRAIDSAAGHEKRGRK